MKSLFNLLFIAVLSASIFSCTKSDNPSVKVTAFSLSEKTATITVGNEKQITAVVTPEELVDDIVWASSNTSVATVSEKGMVKAIAEGKSTITAKIGAQSVSCELTVIGISITISETTLNLNISDKIQLKASLLPEGTEGVAVWTSSNPSIATVSEVGYVTTFASGDVVIIATIGNLKAECKIHVDGPSLKLNVSDAKIRIENTKQLIATVIPSSMQKDVVWSSSSDAIATVSSTGLVTAISVGEATITAKLGELSATCVITSTDEPAEYCIPVATYQKYAQFDQFKFGDLDFNIPADELLYNANIYTYIDNTSMVANVSGNEVELTLGLNQSRTGEGDAYIAEVFIDWNADGDFEEMNEKVYSTEWLAKGKKSFTTKVIVPENAKRISRIRVCFYFKNGKEMNNGCGTMDSGDVRDFMYQLAD